MGKPAARLTDMHVCPMFDGPKPHVGGPITSPGAPTVFIGGLPAARVGDMAICVGPPDFIAPPGAPTVFIGGMPAARLGDMTVHGGRIIFGCFTVLIGTSGAGGSGLGGGAGVGASCPPNCMSEAKKEGLPFVKISPSEPKDAPPTPEPMDKTKFPEERDTLESPEIKEAFPNLGSDFEVLGPSTSDYNCISHTLGKNDVWTNPQTGPTDAPLSKMDKMYADQGYKKTPGMDFSTEPGKQKVVVYATKNSDGSIKEVTHGAIQDGKGSWTSKLGQAPLIRHATPDALRGPVYGEPVAVYERSK